MDKITKTETTKPAEEEPDPLQGKVTIKGDNVPLKTVLRSISRTIKHNLILGPNVDENKVVSVELTDVEVWRALNTILYPSKYGYNIQNNDLIILGEETRIFQLNLPPITQSFGDLTNNESYTANNDSEEASTQKQDIKVGTKIFVENKLDKLSFWEDTTNSVKGLLSKNGHLHPNKTAGTLVVTDLPAHLDKVEAFLKDLNAKVSKQIEVDVRFVEVTLTDEHTFGVDWSAIAKNLGGLNKASLATNFATNVLTSGNSSSVTFSGPNSDSGTNSGGISTVIKALDTYGNVRIVSQPKVVLLNNIASVIQVGTVKTFVEQSTVQTTETGGTVTSITTGQVQEGVTMRLLGNVVKEKVYLSVSPVVTTVDQIRSVKSGDTTIEAPQTTTKSINTLVEVREGQTVAIGGLITTNDQDSKNSVPGISKMPVFGKLFTSRVKKSNRTELIIFITPKRI